MKMYLLIEATEFGAEDVKLYLRHIDLPGVTVGRADTVAGIYDVIASIESPSLDRLDEAVHDRILAHPGIEKISTLLVSRPLAVAFTGPRAFTHTQSAA